MQSSFTINHKQIDSPAELILNNKLKAKSGRRMIYLSSPYICEQNKNSNMRVHRFLEICRTAATLIEQKNVVIFSPVVHFHSISTLNRMEDRHRCLWVFLNSRVMSCCDEVWVLMLAGWAIDTDIRSDLLLAEYMDKPIKYVDPVTLEVNDKPV